MNLNTMRSASILLFTFLSRHRHLGATAFLTSSKAIRYRARPSSFNSQGIDLPTSATISSSSLGSLPSTSQVEADDFMKQLGHASQIIPLLYPQNPDQYENQIIQIDDDTLSEILAKQLSHSDGIRGFFAVYLTSPESLTMEEVPPILAEAVRGADEEIFVPLACMNVLMPTAMTSIHQDPELQECASKTANNGKKILRLVRDKDLVKKNCAAILKVCGGNASEFGTDVVYGDLIEYWEKFFVNYKYKEKQKEDIAVAIAEFC